MPLKKAVNTVMAMEAIATVTAMATDITNKKVLNFIDYGTGPVLLSRHVARLFRSHLKIFKSI
ncbi:hypothetical protein FW774_05530 [Pedobacter sp. BS3]|nr:hypothetical protein FW774_05530 [Pedobacter sp. BS3]